MTATKARRWLIVAASSPSSATTFANSMGIEPQLILGRADLAAQLSQLRGMVRSRGIDAALLHSTAWGREICPQLCQVALALAPVRCRYLADEERGHLRPIGTGELIGWIARLPIDMVAGLGLVGVGITRLLHRQGHPSLDSTRWSCEADRNALLAIWRGSTGSSTGGAVTHLSGILGAFRRAGFRVGLVTAVPPPPQLEVVADEIELAHPSSPAARITRDTTEVLADRSIEEAGLRLARSLRPSLIYQRHATYLSAGTAIARNLRVPLVLEWNASEVWARANWQYRVPFERAFTPLALLLERRIVADADVVAAVSEGAAEMARRAGAPAERVLVVPNGVDVIEVRHALNAAKVRSSGNPLLGWIGTFGPWHGAEILIKALALLPPEVSLVMIGDGVGREATTSLAHSLGVADRISWIGSVPHDVALQRLGDCDVLVSPHVPLPDTPFFGSPTKLFEYMALGRPIVASRLEQLAEVLEDGRTARLVRPGDAVDLRDGILEILQSPDRGAQLGRQARKEAMRRHTWDHRVETILDRLRLTGDGLSGSVAYVTS
jgi:glycosyltransferase involved in cell wall biosynthesis